MEKTMYNGIECVCLTELHNTLQFTKNEKVWFKQYQNSLNLIKDKDFFLININKTSDVRQRRYNKTEIYISTKAADLITDKRKKSKGIDTLINKNNVGTDTGNIGIDTVDILSKSTDIVTGMDTGNNKNISVQIQENLNEIQDSFYDEMFKGTPINNVDESEKAIEEIVNNIKKNTKSTDHLSFYNLAKKYNDD